jgi:hypothetical protein
MNPIGGYFELELRKGKEYHKSNIPLNTGRNALELILKVKRYKKVFIPYYTCDVILEPFYKLKIDYEFYSIDKNFNPLFNFNIIKKNEAFLYTNYFGLKDLFISSLSVICKNLIIDNTQAFYSLPKSGIPTFYSCRKYFGVPDGAYLYMDAAYDLDFPQDYSSDRLKHLLKRIEIGAEAGYNDSKANDESLRGQPIMQMSKLTKALLCNIDYDFARRKRIENFKYFHKQLSKYNELKIILENESVPMVYPFLTNKTNLKQELIENKIFVASYWPNVLEWCSEGSIERRFTQNLINLPIDQRYSEKQLQRVIDLILNHA